MPVKPSENPRYFVSDAKKEPATKIDTKYSSAACTIYSCRLRFAVSGMVRFTHSPHFVFSLALNIPAVYENRNETFSVFIDLAADPRYNRIEVIGYDYERTGETL